MRSWNRKHFAFVLGSFGLAALSLAVSISAAAEKDIKEEKKPEPPRVTVTLPLAVTAGATNHLVIRGQHLTNAMEFRFLSHADSLRTVVTIKARGKAEVPKDADAKKLGDTQIEVELSLPTNLPVGTNRFTVTSPVGTSEPQPLIVLPAGVLVAEKESNGGFKQAQSVRLGQTVAGLIKEGGDVDVFRFAGRRDQRICLEVWAASAGSAIDSVLTLLDATGHPLATSDDRGPDRDSVIHAKLPQDGEYLISLIDAHDKGGPTHAYLLSLREEP